MQLPRCIFVTVFIAIACSCNAMNMPTYDLDSLIYLSTDIAIATLGKTTAAPGRMTDGFPSDATVIKPLYGSLHIGDKTPEIAVYLSFFCPRLVTGQKVILFLDHRPRGAGMFSPSSADCPYAILPAGVYLIDDGQHVHRYFQENNPGGYIEEPSMLRQQLWSFGAMLSQKERQDKNDELRKESEALPMLSAAEAEIRKQIKYVESLRPLLDKRPVVSDIPDLLALLDARRRKSHYDGVSGMYCTDAIPDKIIANLIVLGDRPSLLKAYRVYPSWDIERCFTQPGAGGDKDYSGVAFLIQTLSAKNKNAPARISAAEILYRSSRFGWGENARNAKFAKDVQAEAEEILKTETENEQLRTTCLKLLDLKRPDRVALAANIHSQTGSEDLKFAIEEAFLDIGDSAYETLHPAGGPVASIVHQHPVEDRGWPVPGGALRFWVKYHMELCFRKQEQEAWDAARTGHDVVSQDEYFVLTNRKTAHSMHLKARPCWSSAYYGENCLDVQEKTLLPAGDYDLVYEYSRGDKVVSRGYPLKLTVIATDKGNFIKDPDGDAN
jgi:hypothetical protein